MPIQFYSATRAPKVPVATSSEVSEEVFKKEHGGFYVPPALLHNAEPAKGVSVSSPCKKKIDEKKEAFVRHRVGSMQNRLKKEERGKLSKTKKNRVKLHDRLVGLRQRHNVKDQVFEVDPQLLVSNDDRALSSAPSQVESPRFGVYVAGAGDPVIKGAAVATIVEGHLVFRSCGEAHNLACESELCEQGGFVIPNTFPLPRGATVIQVSIYDHEHDVVYTHLIDQANLHTMGESVDTQGNSVNREGSLATVTTADGNELHLTMDEGAVVGVRLPFEL